MQSWTFDVAVTTHEALQRGETALYYSRWEMAAESRLEAEELAILAAWTIAINRDPDAYVTGAVTLI